MAIVDVVVAESVSFFYRHPLTIRKRNPEHEEDDDKYSAIRTKFMDRKGKKEEFGYGVCANIN
jgi:hypothetical protein